MRGIQSGSDASRALGRLAGCTVVWKTASGVPAEGLCAAFQSHANPFCASVKALKGASARCKRDDVDKVRRAAGYSSRPYLKHCHAGVIELVVPVVEDGVLVGSYQVGPWRRLQDTCRYPECRGGYLALPRFDRHTAREVMRVLWALPIPRQGPGSYRRNSKSEPLERALCFIDRHFRQHMTRIEVANMAFVSPSRISHLFRQHLDTSLVDYLTTLRLEASRILLSNTARSVADIAAEVGYDNPSHFGSQFRREYGCTPGQYRKSAWSRSSA